jgi:hypothetical protein
MKKLVGLIIVVALVSVSMQAQGQKRKGNQRSKMTAEQVATLQVKKMTLAYDLSKSQQEKVQKLLTTQAEKREAMRAAHQKARQENAENDAEMADKRFSLMNARLDDQIEFKTSMKEILNEEQFEKWSKQSQAQKRGKARAKRGQRADRKKKVGEGRARTRVRQ